MATFTGAPLFWYFAWNLAAFVLAWIPHSFLEWISHRFVLHSKAIIGFAYEEHDQRHHNIYRADQSFSIPGLAYGVDFGIRDWLIFLVLVMPMWAVVEFWTGKPILIGAFIAVCCYLHAFNVFHRHFHAPTGAWLEQRWIFAFLKEHHRRHHEQRNRNFNVIVPLADLVLGTRYR